MNEDSEQTVAQQETKNEIINNHNLFWKALGDRDFETRFSLCADDVTFIGSGLNEKAGNIKEYIAINNKGKEQYTKPFKIKIMWQRISLLGHAAIVESELEWELEIGGAVDKDMIRSTVVFNKIDNAWKISHVHGSVPDYRFTGQNYMANDATITRNHELEMEVHKRTKALNEALEDLKNTQSQLIQSEKMASLGELTAGIAHEIQNPLNFVNNFAGVSVELIDEMNDELEKGHIAEAKDIAFDLRNNLDKINHHGGRAGDIVKGMLQHSRSSNDQREPTDINKLADEYLRLAYHGLRARDKTFNAELITSYQEGLPSVNVAPQDIGRALLNLITNAFHAVDDRREKNDIGYQPVVKVQTASMDKKITITVSDNGYGISEEIREKIFQPFFTTKKLGKGTGLGLSLSYDIVKAHGGNLEAHNLPSGGAEFIITLPA